MAKNSKTTKKKNKRKTKRKAVAASAKTTAGPYSNFVAEAGPGCYIARRGEGSPDWILGWEDVDREDFGLDDDAATTEDEDADCGVPDIALDPEEFTLSVCNIHSYTKVAYVTVFETAVVGAKGVALEHGTTTDDTGKTVPCVTFIVLCPPCVFAHLCYLEVASEDDLLGVRIESDISRWNQHPHPYDEHPHRIGFPLSCKGPANNNTAFLCTQGEGGELTHFFSGNLHAIDFRCPIGTELLAVADGVVIDAKDNHTLTGIAVTNLFHWNSILLEIDIHDADSNSNPGNNDTGGGPLFVEYVHIARSTVRAGDRVTRGQVIGHSGSVGFSPEPHLHFSAFRSSEAKAPTVRVLFQSQSDPGGENSEPFLPRAGEWYDANGIVNDPTRRCKSV